MPRTPDEIVNAVAEARGLVTPLPEYFPVSPAMARECILLDRAERAAEVAAARQGREKRRDD